MTICTLKISLIPIPNPDHYNQNNYPKVHYNCVGISHGLLVMQEYQKLPHYQPSADLQSDVLQCLMVKTHR